MECKKCLQNRIFELQSYAACEVWPICSLGGFIHGFFGTRTTKQQERNKKNKTPKGRKINLHTDENKMRKAIGDLGILRITALRGRFLRHKALAKGLVNQLLGQPLCRFLIYLWIVISKLVNDFAFTIRRTSKLGQVCVRGKFENEVWALVF